MKQSEYIVIDLETYGMKTHKRFCNPLDSDHFVVATAYKYGNQKAEVDCDYQGIAADQILRSIDLTNLKLMVFQNGKFDMLWFWSCPRFQKWLKDGGIVWDTMLAEYLLRGQRGKSHGGKGRESLSLDALSRKYGGSLKNTDVSHIFKAGGTVLDIPEATLIEYAKEDVNNTGIVFEAQVKAAKKLGMLPIIKLYNEHLLAVTEMEYNGMYFDAVGAKAMAEEIEIKLKALDENLVSLLDDHELWPSQLLKFNQNSPQHLANIFFGGPISAVVKKPLLDDEGNHLRFKSGQKQGQLRYRNTEVQAYVPGLNETFQNQWLTDKGGRGTGVKVLKELVNVSKNKLTKEIINNILEYRKYNKILSTYLYKENDDGNITGLVPMTHKDDCVHTEYQMVETETGRLSSKNPNLQNVPPFVMELFKSRFQNGKVVELDFSQLEVVVQAFITQAPNMIQDIKDGVDFHCLRLSYAEGNGYEETVTLCAEDEAWKQKRKKAKIVSFQKAYGAHTSKIATETGLDEDTIKLIFEKEDERYPEISNFYDNIINELDKNMYETGLPLDVRVDGVYITDRKLKQKQGRYQSLTGKLYTFDKKAVRTNRGVFEYWPGPSVMNYPVQGTAADIVAMQTARVFRFMLQHRDKGLMINEIHDSNLLDVKAEHVEYIVPKVQKILADVEGSFKKYFGMEFNVPIGVDVGIGDNWLEAK